MKVDGTKDSRSSILGPFIRTKCVQYLLLGIGAPTAAVGGVGIADAALMESGTTQTAVVSKYRYDLGSRRPVYDGPATIIDNKISLLVRSGLTTTAGLGLVGLGAAGFVGRRREEKNNAGQGEIVEKK